MFQIPLNWARKGVLYRVLGKLKNVLQISASINGSFDQTITDEIVAANIYPEIEESVLNQVYEKKYRVYDIAGTIYEKFISHQKGRENS